MKSISNLTGKVYEDEDHVFFRNPLQSAFYYYHGAELVDLFVGKDLKWVWTFKKSDHNKLKLIWKENNKED